MGWLGAVGWDGGVMGGMVHEWGMEGWVGWWDGGMVGWCDGWWSGRMVGGMGYDH